MAEPTERPDYGVDLNEAGFPVGQAGQFRVGAGDSFRAGRGNDLDRGRGLAQLREAPEVLLHLVPCYLAVVADPHAVQGAETGEDRHLRVEQSGDLVASVGLRVEQRWDAAPQVLAAEIMSATRAQSRRVSKAGESVGCRPGDEAHEDVRRAPFICRSTRKPAKDLPRGVDCAPFGPPGAVMDRNGAEGTRTPDPHAASVMLSQLSYCPVTPRRPRTPGSGIGARCSSCRSRIKPDLPAGDRWRECVGIEPTEDRINCLPRGFEALASHQTRATPHAIVGSGSSGRIAPLRTINATDRARELPAPTVTDDGAHCAPPRAPAPPAGAPSAPAPRRSAARRRSADRSSSTRSASGTPSRKPHAVSQVRRRWRGHRRC